MRRRSTRGRWASRSPLGCGFGDAGSWQRSGTSCGSSTRSSMPPRDRRRLLIQHPLEVDQDLEGLIDRVVPYAMTTTSIIQSNLVKRRPPPVGATASPTATHEELRRRTL